GATPHRLGERGPRHRLAGHRHALPVPARRQGCATARERAPLGAHLGAGAVSVPLTRSLPVVLRDLVAPDRENYAEALSARQGRLLAAGTCRESLPAPHTDSYANVVVNGQTVKVPKLAGARTVMGAPAYLLALGDFMLLIGTVTTIGRQNVITGTWGWITTTS